MLRWLHLKAIDRSYILLFNKYESIFKEETKLGLQDDQVTYKDPSRFIPEQNLMLN